MTERRNKYSRTLEDPLGYERHGMTSVRDREAPGSNPGPPTIFVFKIGDSGGCPESADQFPESFEGRDGRG